MNAECFLDTNVLVYAAAGRKGDEPKRQRAIEIIETADCGLSSQVLQEFYVCIVGKIADPMTPAAAMEWIKQFRVFPCVPVDADLVELAIGNSVRNRISYWDGAIVAAAELLGATTLYSEDLSHGKRISSVRVVNPFADLRAI